jgi:hypothetical protein
MFPFFFKKKNSFMATTTTVNDWTTAPSSPKHATMIQQLPDSPDELEKYATNSDDLQPTSHLSSSASVLNMLNKRQPITIVGSHERSITLGRGGSSTIKIGRRNRQISRTHVSISFNNDKFELIVVGLNGACVDGNQVAQHDVVTLENDSFIDILGDHFYFKVPPPPLHFSAVEEVQGKKPVSVNKDILRELSPDAKERQQQVLQEQQPIIQQEEETVVEKEQFITAKEQVEQEQEEEEEEEEGYPVELVPEEALSSLSSADEKELSPEPVAEEAAEEALFEEKVKKQVKKEAPSPLQENSNKQEVIEEDTNDYAEVIIDALGKYIFNPHTYKIQDKLIHFLTSILSYIIHAN